MQRSERTLGCVTAPTHSVTYIAIISQAAAHIHCSRHQMMPNLLENHSSEGEYT